MHILQFDGHYLYIVAVDGGDAFTGSRHIFCFHLPLLENGLILILQKTKLIGSILVIVIIRVYSSICVHVEYRIYYDIQNVSLF